jgi:hypothetical protein
METISAKIGSLLEVFELGRCHQLLDPDRAYKKLGSPLRRTYILPLVF